MLPLTTKAACLALDSEACRPSRQALIPVVVPAQHLPVQLVRHVVAGRCPITRAISAAVVFGRICAWSVVSIAVRDAPTPLVGVQAPAAAASDLDDVRSRLTDRAWHD